MKKAENKRKILSIVVPCFNEQACIEEINKKLQDVLSNLIKTKEISSKSFIEYVDDGSTDGTWNTIKSLKGPNEIRGVKLSGNTGQQHALLCGLKESLKDADIFITIDADGQDDHNAIYQMVKNNIKGDEIVYGVRLARKEDSKIRGFIADIYYWIIRKLGVKSVDEHPEFRLMSKKVVEYICKHNQSSLYIRGICASLNVKSSSVYYVREKRKLGISKYNFSKLVQTAFDGISNAGAVPLTSIIYAGLLFILLGIISFVLTLIYNCNGLYAFILIISGINLIALGVVAQYVGRILIESQNRPIWDIEKKIIKKGLSKK